MRRGRSRERGRDTKPIKESRFAIGRSLLTRWRIIFMPVFGDVRMFTAKGGRIARRSEERKFPAEHDLHGIRNGLKKDSLTYFRRKKCDHYTYFRCNFCLKMICCSYTVMLGFCLLIPMLLDWSAPPWQIIKRKTGW